MSKDLFGEGLISFRFHRRWSAFADVEIGRSLGPADAVGAFSLISNSLEVIFLLGRLSVVFGILGEVKLI
jgi:hypothetical protein